MAVIESGLPSSPVRQGRPGIRTIGTLRIDPYQRDVSVDGESVELTRKEYDLVCVLAAEPTRVFTKRELLRDIWGIRGDLQTRTLDSHAHRLRKKLGGGFVLSVWGVGYRLMPPSPVAASPGPRRFLIEETHQHLILASGEEEAEAIWLDKGEEGVLASAVTGRVVQEVGRTTPMRKEVT